jgi:hypothetical protein
VTEHCHCRRSGADLLVEIEVELADPGIAALIAQKIRSLVTVESVVLAEAGA